MMRLTDSSVVVATLVLILTQAARAQTWHANSPDGQLVATVELNDTLSWRIDRGGKSILLPSPLGLKLEGDGGDFSGGLKPVKQSESVIDESYPAISGKRSKVTNRARELVLAFTNAAGRNIELVVRAYDDGAAMRYRLVGEGDYRVAEETSAFVLPAGANIWAQIYSNNGETEYTKRSLAPPATQPAPPAPTSRQARGQQRNPGDWGQPVLAETPDGNWMLLTQANTDGSYAALHLRFQAGEKPLLRWVFPPDQRTPITGSLPLATPWRVVIAGASLGTIVESDLIQKLCPPSKIDDTSWVKPGRVAWSWWSDHQSPKSLAAQKEFVDFASEMTWEYVLVDEGWNAAWVPELIAYAKQKNVDIILWTGAKGFNESTARQWADWGVKGAKLDFIDSDRQEAFAKVYQTCLEATAKHKLLVNFHGAAKPSGLERTWPHNLTREGVMGGERVDVKSGACINYVYTRNVIGPMDYTPVQLSRLPTTVGLQLAQCILFESGLQHFVDTPERYRAFAGKDLLKVIPVTWDETKFIDGRPDEFAAIARRKGADWYVGVATTAKIDCKLPLKFLDPARSYQATIYRDGATKTDLVVDTKTVKAGDEIEVPLLKDGGCSIRLVQQP